MNKKGQYLLWGWMIGIITILGTMFYLSSQVYDDDGAFIGDDALSILEGSERFERTITQLDIISEASYHEFLKIHSSNNFIPDDSDCEYLINPIYTDTCKPKVEGVEEQVRQEFNAMQTQIKTDVTVPNIEVSIENETVIYATPENTLETIIYKEPQTGISSRTGETTPLGEQLVTLQGIPYITCGPNVNCKAIPTLKNQLEQFSQEYLQQNNIEMYITSAYRSRADQLRQLRENGGDTTYACDPTTTVCPHMTGKAIDMNLIYNNSRNLNNPTNTETEKVSRNRVRKVLCEYGFINYWPEHWHYEYESNQWKQQRQNNPNNCAYNDPQNRDWSQIAMWKEVDGDIQPVQT